MSTPLKALIQERLRTKICRRGALSDADALDTHTHTHTQQQQQQQQRGDDGELLLAARYTTRLRPYVEPAMYLVPSQIDTRFFLSPETYGADVSVGRLHGDGTRIRYRRYGQEQPQPQPQPQHARGDPSRDAASRRPRAQRPPREQRAQYEATQEPSKRIASPKAAWRRREAYHRGAKARNTPARGLSPCGRGESDASDQRGFLRGAEGQYSHSGDSSRQSAPLSTLPSPEYTQMDLQMHMLVSPPSQLSPDFRFDWGEREQHRVLRTTRDEASPVRHHHAPCSQPTARSAARCSHSNQLEGKYAHENDTSRAAVAVCTRPQSDAKASTNAQPPAQRVRQLPSPLRVVVEPPMELKRRRRVRPLEVALSPDSRQAAKAFVEKRQRRAGKGTPRTLATQRWLQTVDSAAVLAPPPPHMRC